ncbi:MAG TPA: hypothetical protein VGE01_13385 [Fimbriimonas sp.]
MKKNWLEWTVAGVSLVMVLATLAFLASDALSGPRKPPFVELTLKQPESHGNGFLVPVVAENMGGQTAEGVKVEVVLTPSSGEKETAGFDIDYLPRQSKREGWVRFDEDPRRGKLEAKVLGFEKP